MLKDEVMRLVPFPDVLGPNFIHMVAFQEKRLNRTVFFLVFMTVIILPFMILLNLLSNGITLYVEDNSLNPSHQLIKTCIGEHLLYSGSLVFIYLFLWSVEHSE